MKLKYHQKTMDLLGIEPVIEETPELIAWQQWAKENNIILPESFLEFWSIKGLEDIFSKISNYSSLTNMIDKSTIERDLICENLLCFDIDGHAETWEMRFPLDGSDDPKVIDTVTDSEYCDKLSNYFYTKIFDDQLSYNEITYTREDIVKVCYTEPINDIIIESFNNIFEKEPITYYSYALADDKRVIRYSLNDKNIRFILLPMEHQYSKYYSTFFLQSKTKEGLVELNKILLEFLAKNNINLIHNL